MHFLIIEDEKPAARLLQRKLEKAGYPQVNLVHSVAEADAWLAANQAPDLIFMDIQLSDGTAFDLLEKSSIPSAIIFTTAFDAYTLRAFKENSVDYLLKPIVESELINAIKKYVSQATIRHDLTTIKSLLGVNHTVYKDRFTVKIGQFLRPVEVNKIVCFYSAHGGTYLRTIDEHDYLIDHTLDQLASLINPKDFFRISRSYIIQLHGIRDIAIHSNSRLKVTLQNLANPDLIVSRERVNDFKAWLG
ncbi:LytTR family DNA-binding domain-containing protein [Sphingobacterium sp. lm-10]|uniref:LytR/AlgR family response regulator transcription factor n=1 Tax=Sphingobacterium sp. lm-10 TaxID=2944904 RepID=UPI0020204E0E|nr:LytTR family DNA-binding domain-containing protein [Sphingobacterium sp. lm-10]MCL7988603.1 LytTR family DNA-binding domain-containing protein [Sphingobacterium sp. lm-10]